MMRMYPTIKRGEELPPKGKSSRETLAPSTKTQLCGCTWQHAHVIFGIRHFDRGSLRVPLGGAWQARRGYVCFRNAGPSFEAVQKSQGLYQIDCEFRMAIKYMLVLNMSILN